MWHHLVSPDITWHHLASRDITWHHVTSPGITWYHLVLCDIMWHHLVSPDITWHHLVSPDITWHHWYHLTSHTTWYHVTSCDTTWYYDIIWDHVTTSWYHMTSCDITDLPPRPLRSQEGVSVQEEEGGQCLAEQVLCPGWRYPKILQENYCECLDCCLTLFKKLSGAFNYNCKSRLTP